jgi:hypothetical protein
MALPPLAALAVGLGMTAHTVPPQCAPSAAVRERWLWSPKAMPPQRFVAWDVSVPLPGAVDRSRIPSSAADRGRGRRVPDEQTLRSSWPCGGSRNVTARADRS